MARKYNRQYKAKYSKRWIENCGDELIEWIGKDGNLYIKKFLAEKFLNTSKIKKFKKENEYFNFCYENVRDRQESKFIELGKDGKANTFIIFLLKNIAGFKDNPDDPNALNESELQKLRDIIKEETEKQI